MMSSQTALDKLHREAHAWFIVPEAVRDASILESCLSLLCEQELQQYRRFHFDADRHRYLVSHALVRKVLSMYFDLAPAEWRFSRSEHGKPEIANPGIPALRFNLTHTAGLAGCVVTFANACGIDAEQISERHNPLGVAERMFSEPECEQLQCLQGRDHLESFFKGWTLREAYVKARGIGIYFPTAKLHFEIDGPERIQVEFQADINDCNDDWQFRLLSPTREHIAAIAISRDGQSDKTIVSRMFEM